MLLCALDIRDRQLGDWLPNRVHFRFYARGALLYLRLWSNTADASI
jgi:hypothetical protein